jgi:signal peptidase I
MTRARAGQEQVTTEHHETESKDGQKETTVEFLASMAVVLVTGLFIITFVMQAFEIPSSSMENTLLIGDHLFVNREQFAPATKWTGPLLPYRMVRRGDVVVFLSPAEPGLYLVKRVIGIPGDRIHLRGGEVYRNGEKLSEEYVMHKAPDIPNPFRDEFPSVSPSNSYDVSPEWRALMSSYVEGDDLVVPADSYFGMGDNRDVSRDSRYWGFIPQANLIGRPMFIYWSFETPPNQYLRTKLIERVQIVGNTILHFFNRTRWSRTLKAVQ